MRRQSLTDGSGRWFDLDAAQEFEEATFWDGDNTRSRATMNQWDHEALYRTAGGRWVRHWWSSWSGTVPSWEEVTEADAAAWLVKCGYDPAAAGLEAATAELEV